MGLSFTVSEINGDFGRKSQFFSATVYFALPLKGFPLELGTGAGVKKTRVMGLPGRERSLTISSAVWIQYTNVSDRRTDTGRQQRPRLRIASRGKNGRDDAIHNLCESVDEQHQLPADLDEVLPVDGVIEQWTNQTGFE